jgi:hypothetical protein
VILVRWPSSTFKRKSPELIAGLSLLINVRARAGAVVAVSVMAVVTIAVLLALARGLNIECGCFGTAGAGRIGMLKLLENLGILAIAMVGVLAPRPGGERIAAAGWCAA